MYSKNDYRYYLEHRLMMSDDFLAHYNHNHDALGRFAASMSVSGRRSSLQTKRAANDKQIKQLESDGSTAKAKKLKSKNSKIDKKIKKLNTKEQLSFEKGVYKDVKSGINQAERNSARDYLQGKTSKKDYGALMDTYNQMRVNNKALYKVDKARVKNPDTFKTSKDAISSYMKSQGSSADDYIVTSTFKNGFAKTYQPVWNSGPLKDVNSDLKSIQNVRSVARKERASKKKK